MKEATSASANFLHNWLKRGSTADHKKEKDDPQPRMPTAEDNGNGTTQKLHTPELVLFFFLAGTKTCPSRKQASKEEPAYV